ncbi:L-arabinonate dehydratase [Paramicrobacterium agarici]|uniref:L-arabinonate dehydratase n=1 Tax=Paramicrobacterium agarici TaxID=630514 RepID=UPI00115472BF|nr:L-arabinonate dehydratase [Microbacterium agarici]TQO22292.1 dihydroxy-acid dehydratase [Microbacterium agarici]
MENQESAEISLRSSRWFAATDLRSFGHRSRAAQLGYSAADYAGKPVIAIVNTWNSLSPCHAHFPERVEAVRRGVLQAGGFPLEFPALSLSEPFQKPTTMLYRNLLAMEVEETLRSHPIDGAVLMGGCDKTTPGLIMGASSADMPSVFMPAGPMLPGRWGNTVLGSGSDSWKFWDQKRAGTISEDDWAGIEAGIARSPGHCMTMGTASTMTSAAEALGLTLPGAASIPAAFSDHARMAAESGRLAVDLALKGRTPASFLTKTSFENAITVVMALGGSTNAIIHLIAMARRLEIDVSLDDFDRVSRDVPVIANIRPSGEYLMEAFYDAGGLPALMRMLGELLDGSAETVAGSTLGQDIASATVFNNDVIRPLDNPIAGEGALAVLRGSLAPDGAVIKTSAATEELLHHRGPAVVFDGYKDMKARIDDESIHIDANSVLILRDAGPIGGPGMPEWGQLPIPARLLKQGVTDMVRISDARMSGTSYGACVLHVAPESALGGPLALVETGDIIELDTKNRRLDLLVDEDVLESRRAAWKRPEPKYARGYGALAAAQITQANEGCDFAILEGAAPTPEPAIY